MRRKNANCWKKINYNVKTCKNWVNRYKSVNSKSYNQKNLSNNKSNKFNNNYSNCNNYNSSF